MKSFCVELKVKENVSTYFYNVEAASLKEAGDKALNIARKAKLTVMNIKEKEKENGM